MTYDRRSSNNENGVLGKHVIETSLGVDSELVRQLVHGELECVDEASEIFSDFGR
jgi:hypothetical protein